MRCPHCNSMEAWRNGWHDSKQGRIQLYRCKKCNRRYPERYLGSFFAGKHLTDEHKRNMSVALRRTYGLMSPEELKALHIKQQAGRAKREHPSQQRGFIGKLGDIEVYALRVGRVGRPTPGLPNKWDRLPDGHPKLESPRKRAGGGVKSC